MRGDRESEAERGEERGEYVVECMVYGVESEYRNQLMDVTRVINLPLPFLIFPNPLLFTSLPPLYLSLSSFLISSPLSLPFFVTSSSSRIRPTRT